MIEHQVKVLFPNFVWRVCRKFLDLIFVYFVLIWWQIDKKQERNPEAELQEPVYTDKTANCVIN